MRKERVLAVSIVCLKE